MYIENSYVIQFIERYMYPPFSYVHNIMYVFKIFVSISSKRLIFINIRSIYNINIIIP